MRPLSFFLAVLVSATPACAAPGDTLAQLKALAADAACTTDNQCRSLPLGESPCGGPESYLAYSSAGAPAAGSPAAGSPAAGSPAAGAPAAGSPAATILKLGERYRTERRAANRVSGRMGACRFTPDPGAVCKAGRCVLGTPGFLVQ